MLRITLNRPSRYCMVFSAAFIAAVFCCGCAGIEPPNPEEVIRQPLGTGGLKVGMTKAEVESLWGKPDEIRTVEDTKKWSGPREMWVYHATQGAIPVDVTYLSKTKKLYFDGNNLTDIGK